MGRTFLLRCIGNGDDDFADNGGSSGEPAGRQRLLGRQRARAKRRSAGWQLLFDGTSTAGWHGYNKQDTKAWTIEDCSLKTTGTQGNYGSDKRADLVTDTEFTNFELTLDWKASTGGNSGVIYGVIEDQYDAPWKTGPEYQLSTTSASRRKCSRHRRPAPATPCILRTTPTKC